MRKHQKNQNEIIQDLAEEWRKETGNASINVKEVVVWMMRKKGWQPKPYDAIRALAKEVQVALREQYFTDPQGRRVRLKHPQKIPRKMADGSHEQLVLWHDMQDPRTTRPQMQAALQQRRFGVALDCRRLKTDADSYNENYNKSVPIQIVFDFTEDMEEFDQDGIGGDPEPEPE